MNRLDGAPTLPIKDDTDLAVEALAQQILRDYDVTPQQAMQMARSQVMQTQDEQAQSGFDSPEARLAQSHADAGASPERAARRAANQVQTYGPTGAAGLAAEYETPEGMSRLQQAQAEIDADDARHQKMYDDYFRGSASPTHWSVPPEEAKRDEYNERKRGLHKSYMRDGLHPQQVVDPGTPEQNARWEAFLAANPEEMAKYRPDEFAAQQAEADEAAFTERRPLLVKRYGEDEVAKMEASRKAGRAYVPNTKEQRDRNQTTEELVTGSMQGHTPSAALLRAREGRYRQDVTRPRQLREIGLATDLSGERLNSALGLKETATPAEADARIRSLLREQRQESKQASDMLWKPRAMIRGGNAIGAMFLPGQDDWGRAAILGGPTPLDVQARQADMAAKMAQQAVTGFLANSQPNMTPEQRRLAGIKATEAEQALPASERAASHRDDAAVHPSEITMADEYVAANYSRPAGLLGTTSSFTAKEQQDTIDWLVGSLGYKLPKAQKIVDEIAKKRGGQSWLGNWD